MVDNFYGWFFGKPSKIFQKDGDSFPSIENGLKLYIIIKELNFSPVICRMLLVFRKGFIVYKSEHSGLKIKSKLLNIIPCHTCFPLIGLKQSTTVPSYFDVSQPWRYRGELINYFFLNSQSQLCTVAS